jgi:hypothetical protein
MPMRAQRGQARGRVADRRAVHADRPLLEGLEAVDGLDERRLARAGRAAHDDHVAARDARRAVAQDLEGAVPLADIVDFDHLVFTEFGRA